MLTSQSPDGLHVFDDFREAYAWLSHNTEVDDKVSSILFYVFRLQVLHHAALVFLKLYLFPPTNISSSSSFVIISIL